MTTTTSTTDVPLACVPDAIPARDRVAHFARLTRLFTDRARERRDRPDGYSYRFDADAFDELAHWISLERRCCPFLHFTIELTPDNGAIHLHLSGASGTRAFLDAELPTTNQ